MESDTSNPLTIHDIAKELKARDYQIDLPLQQPQLWNPGVGNRVRGHLVPQGVRPDDNTLPWLNRVMQRGFGSTAYELLWEVLRMHRLIESGRVQHSADLEHPLLVAPGSIVLHGGRSCFTCVRTTTGARRAFLVNRASLLKLLAPNKLVLVYGTNM